MIFSLNAAMMDFLILTVICSGDAYGYQISQILRSVSTAKDSVLYPILRRLQESGYVAAYDQPFQGRNRKYYRITETGRAHQQKLLEEWRAHQRAIEEIIQGGNGV